MKSKPMRGSKYVWSWAGDTFPEIKKYLEAGRTVMFTGLKNYLRKDYDNLYMMDCLCGGTSSLMAFQLWIETTGQKIIQSAYAPKQAIKQGMIQVQKPERWLQLLRDAEYVVTNSFHATVFSILFHKKFFTVVHGEKAKGINVRMNDFLTSVGLEDRIYSSIPNKIDTEDIDYTDADEKIASLREESLTFL